MDGLCVAIWSDLISELRRKYVVYDDDLWRVFWAVWSKRLGRYLGFLDDLDGETRLRCHSEF